MVTIKGPFTIKPKSENKEFMKKLEESGTTIKLPFKATGFKCSKMPEGFEIDAENGLLLPKGTKVEKIVKPKVEKEPVVIEEEPKVIVSVSKDSDELFVEKVKKKTKRSKKKSKE